MKIFMTDKLEKNYLKIVIIQINSSLTFLLLCWHLNQTQPKVILVSNSICHKNLKSLKSIRLLFLYLIQSYLSQMIVLPWYVRFSIDCVIVVVPFYFIYKYPRLIFAPFRDSRRRERRLTFQQANRFLSTTPALSVQQTRQFYKSIKREL